MAGARGLLGKLAARDGRGLRGGSEVDSVLEHLKALLNTRQGEAPTAPDFGVVDFTDLMHNFPEAIRHLERSIRASVLAYEPRLKNVHVTHIKDEERPLELRFQITATLVGRNGRGNVRIETRMEPGGKFQVSS